MLGTERQEAYILLLVSRLKKVMPADQMEKVEAYCKRARLSPKEASQYIDDLKNAIRAFNFKLSLMNQKQI